MLKIHLLSPFRVYVDGKAIPETAWNGRLPRSLLKILALSPLGKSADELIDILWPDHAPAQARHRLYEVTSRLRRTLTHGSESLRPHASSSWPIEKTETGYRLADSTWVDIRCFFEKVESIRRLYSTNRAEAMDQLLRVESIDPGDLLSEDPYADWAISARERVLAATLTLDRMRVESFLEQGRDSDALECLTRMLELNPTCEQTGRQAIEIALRLGDRARAFDIFHRLRDALKDDVGVAPSDETMAWYNRVLDGFPNQPRALVSHSPAPSVGFIGREKDLSLLAEALERSRLLTLQGTGGIGKTTLALKAANRLSELYVDGCYWIDLSPLRVTGMLPQFVAAALGIRELPDRPPLATLCDELASKRFLLVLDNCEHRLDEVRHLTNLLLQACPDVRILATSQAPLGVPGEHVHQVPPLSLPDPNTPLSVGQAVRYDAIALFVERGKEVRQGFQLTAENLESVVRICWRLDGIPLAIELAAKRLTSLSPKQIADRLDQRFQLLRPDHSHEPSHSVAVNRHRSLQALVDWTYELLPDPERQLWARMSVFAGDFSLETAEFMCRNMMASSSDFTILHALSTLVDRSIVVAEESKGVWRYRFLETFRDYGLLKLQSTGTEHEVRQRHLEWCLRAVTKWKDVYCSSQEVKWMEELATEYDEIREALNWSIEHSELDGALQLVGSLWWFWIVRGYTDEGRIYVHRALERAKGRRDLLYAMALHAQGPLHLINGQVEVAKANVMQSVELLAEIGEPSEYARVYLSLAMALLAEGDLEGATQEFQTSLKYARETGDERNLAVVCWQLGNIALRQGNIQAAKGYLHESLALTRKVGYARGEAGCMGGLGIAAFYEGHEGLAEHLLEEGIALCRGMDDHYFGSLLLDYLGWISRQRGDPVRALSLHRESLSLKWSAGNRIGIADTLHHMAETEVSQGNYERAATLFGAIEGSMSPTGAGLLPVSALALKHRAITDRDGVHLDEADWEEAWEKGRIMRAESIVSFALGTTEIPANLPQASRLPRG